MAENQAFGQDVRDEMNSLQRHFLERDRAADIDLILDLGPNIDAYLVAFPWLERIDNQSNEPFGERFFAIGRHIHQHDDAVPEQHRDAAFADADRQGNAAERLLAAEAMSVDTLTQ